MQIETTEYRGWPNCRRLSNALVDLVVTADVGPRVIRFGWRGEDNEFYEDPVSLGLTGGDEWRLYGGHRLWHAPEAYPRTISPDNSPVVVSQGDGFVRFVQPVELETHLQKEIDITLYPGQARARVTHRLRNHGLWAVEFAPWALSVMAAGGTAVIPLPPRGTHPADLLPTGGLVLWAYTDMADARWTWGREYVLLRQDQNSALPQKIGSRGTEGWLAYANRGRLFVKTYEYISGSLYPDLGSAVEVFTNADMLELETLGPLVKVEPGATVEHVEDWFLFRDVPAPQDDAGVSQHVLPKVKQAQSAAV